MVYKKEQKFINMKRELKSIKGLLSKTTHKLISTKREEKKKPYEDRHFNPPHFKLVVTPNGRPRTWGKVLSPFRSPSLYVSLAEVTQYIEFINHVN